MIRCRAYEGWTVRPLSGRGPNARGHVAEGCRSRCVSNIPVYNWGCRGTLRRGVVIALGLARRSCWGGMLYSMSSLVLVMLPTARLSDWRSRAQMIFSYRFRSWSVDDSPSEFLIRSSFARLSHHTTVRLRKEAESARSPRLELDGLRGYREIRWEWYSSVHWSYNLDQL